MDIDNLNGLEWEIAQRFGVVVQNVDKGVVFDGVVTLLAFREQ